ncbi:eyes absent homolog, partial [Caerostris extrusa]
SAYSASGFPSNATNAQSYSSQQGVDYSSYGGYSQSGYPYYPTQGYPYIPPTNSASPLGLATPTNVPTTATYQLSQLPPCSTTEVPYVLDNHHPTSQVKLETTNGTREPLIKKSGKSGKGRGRRLNNPSPDPENNLERVFVWDLDETIIIFHSLLTGTYANRYGKELRNRFSKLLPQKPVTATTYSPLVARFSHLCVGEIFKQPMILNNAPTNQEKRFTANSEQPRRLALQNKNRALLWWCPATDVSQSWSARLPLCSAQVTLFFREESTTRSLFAAKKR